MSELKTFKDYAADAIVTRYPIISEELDCYFYAAIKMNGNNDVTYEVVIRLKNYKGNHSFMNHERIEQIIGVGESPKKCLDNLLYKMDLFF